MSATTARSAANNDDPTHELDAPPWLRVESTLIGAAQAIRDAYDARLAPLGLTLSLASLLCYITDFGPVSQSRAAEHLGQGRAATGVQVDRLQSLGYIERRPHPDDRRVWMVAATDSGRALAGDVAAIDEVLRSELRAGISRAERQQLAAVLVRLQRNLAAAITGTSSSPQSARPEPSRSDTP